jgi:hypothetical protein
LRQQDPQKWTYNAIAEQYGLSPGYVAKKFYLERKNDKIEYEDKLEYAEQDISEYIEQMIRLQETQRRLDTKQVKATIRINDDKPVGILFWGDWHIGSTGTDYRLFEEDLQKIRDTDGLYFIGAGDYKDNYITGTHIGGGFGQIIQPGAQDIVVKHYMEQVGDKCLALIRGCHDHWDEKQGDKDFIATLCEVTDSVNLWHGGEVYIKLGDMTYLWRCRHKYKYQSSLNLENAMRRIMEIQGPCDVAAEAHLHNAYVMERHLMGEYRIMLRTGSYKIWDDYAQQLAGYKGKPSVPMIILYPNQRKIVYHRDLDTGIEILKGLRHNFNLSTKE